MDIHRPAAVGHGIVKDAVGADVVFIEEVITDEAAALAAAGHGAHPVEVEVLRAVVGLIFNMIPDAVEHLEKILVDLLALLNDILGVAAQLDPPVAGVDIRKLGQLVLRRVDGDESAAVCLGADAIDMRAIFQVFLRVGIGPDGLDKGHGLAAVDCR